MHALSPRLLVALALALPLCLPAGHAQAQAPQAPPSIVLAPATSMGDSSDKALRRVEELVESGLASLGSHRVISAKEADKSSRKAKKPQLRACDGEATCLADLAALVGAEYAVYAEVGGLGDAQVVYLKLVGAKERKELRSTTLEIGDKSNRSAQAQAAATRLVDPKRYVGQLELEANVEGATIFLDGHKVGMTPSGPITVFVGSHALRVTHPEHQDYVRFVDIEFGTSSKQSVEMKQLTGVDRSLSAEGVIGGDPRLIEKSGGTVYGPRPWYRRWYVVAGGAAAIAITSAALMSGAAGGIDADTIKKLSDL